ncbi:hypothetical protein EDB89DRAFT_1906055 [Lactarius sanguifluus]|nr:hypothetical protein EDB89DRAFT_1906055 [Lactarius sanguifluus]
MNSQPGARERDMRAPGQLPIVNRLWALMSAANQPGKSAAAVAPTPAIEQLPSDIPRLECEGTRTINPPGRSLRSMLPWLLVIYPYLLEIFTWVTGDRDSTNRPVILLVSIQPITRMVSRTHLNPSRDTPRFYTTVPSFRGGWRYFYKTDECGRRTLAVGTRAPGNRSCDSNDVREPQQGNILFTCSPVVTIMVLRSETDICRAEVIPSDNLSTNSEQENKCKVYRSLGVSGKEVLCLGITFV